MSNVLSIGYISVDDPRDKRAWSGTHASLLEALERHGARVELFGPLRPQPILALCKALNQLALLFGRRFNYRDSYLLARAYARILDRKLAARPVDLIIAPAGLATTALLKTKTPIIYVNDRSVAGALGYHKVLIDLLAFSRKESLQLEAEAIANASMVVFASRWAAEAAAKAVPAQARKISVIPFGANLERLPAPPLPIDFPGEVLNLLFIGVHWNDKGGPIAVQALQELRRRGHRARLIVCGCDVPREIDDHDIVREGFLDKRVTEQRARLEAHFRDAHFLMLPTRFEAYGIAFCEAAAYGVPALGTRTGGVPTIVEDGITGFLFDPEEDGCVYADRVEMLMNDPARWQRMRVAARERFEKHFTWDAFVGALFDQATAAGLIKSSR